MRETRHILDAKKQQIQANLLSLFDVVQRAIGDAVSCLDGTDKQACQVVIDRDPEINEARRLLEQDCLVAIASQQPVAHDLRDIVACMRIATELERIGDYASDIAAGVLQMEGNDLRDLGLQKVLDMSRICVDMLEGVSNAFRERDNALAKTFASMDDQIDQAQQELDQTLFDSMKSQPHLVPDASRMLWITHNLERCGDRATNIAEQVVFMVESEHLELD
jgi:phosphate transport system protein